MNLRDLESFVCVAERQSFSAAAQALGFEQSTVSRHVKALERLWGMALLLRSTRSVLLTPAGAAVLPRAQHLLKEVSELRRYAAGVRAGEKGRPAAELVLDLDAVSEIRSVARQPP